MSRNAPEVAEDLRRFGAPETVAAAQEDTGRTDGLPIVPANWRAVRLYILCATQWRWVSGLERATRSGFDYASVAVVAKSCGWRLSRDLMLRLQIMETETLALDAERRK